MVEWRSGNLTAGENYLAGRRVARPLPGRGSDGLQPGRKANA